MNKFCEIEQLEEKAIESTHYIKLNQGKCAPFSTPFWEK